MIAGWLAAFLAEVAIESADSAEEALAALARQIKAEPDPPTVVVMTQKSDERFEADCAAAGADSTSSRRASGSRSLAELSLSRAAV